MPPSFASLFWEKNEGQAGSKQGQEISLGCGWSESECAAHPSPKCPCPASSLCPHASYGSPLLPVPPTRPQMHHANLLMKNPLSVMSLLRPLAGPLPGLLGYPGGSSMGRDLSQGQPMQATGGIPAQSSLPQKTTQQFHVLQLLPTTGAGQERSQAQCSARLWKFPLNRQQSGLPPFTKEPHSSPPINNVLKQEPLAEVGMTSDAVAAKPLSSLEHGAF